MLARESVTYKQRQRVLAESTRRDSNAVHKAADAHYKPMMLAVSAAFMKGKKAYKASGTDAAVKAIHVELRKTLPPVLTKCFVAGANVGQVALKLRSAMRALTPKKPITMRFDITNQDAIDWAEEHAAELANELSETSLERIQDAIARALEGDGLDAAYDDILDAVGDEARADMIARTEIMDAANQGLAQSWNDARDEGLLPPDTMKVWIATSGACDDCDALDGEEVLFDDDFSSGDDMPPAHPNCRCTTGLSFGDGE